jgi:hypothetical protein
MKSFLHLSQTDFYSTIVAAQNLSGFWINILCGLGGINILCGLGGQ